ncbi:ATP-grasp fold amidoligase family protein [Tetragenococcus muriaticus]|uniref:ATP-grasp fold amidoligase family protein n=1 Tax=Tetragenococcus muriaticus TaxID=64642 RepID=UPI000400D1BD|nr:ATP-grasp fold amidoligase family protein [Tetragenococcus muriaticus]GMA45856.1 glycosyl transferase [Tetragenococcus muriaticus]GMA45929.1 glycosyl transferase [Tetragenococcus muriaticus]GMA46292.1 glycosyl transferase [Tetragenococcus muriaticus]
MKLKFFYQKAKNYVLNKMIRAGFFNWMSDENYIKWRFKQKIKKNLDLENPRTFSEKLQWLKLYDHNPMYTKMSDKFEAKYYVSRLIGDQYIIPTLGIWESFDDIDFTSLPNKFVLKCTHDSGGVVICRDKNSFDKQKAKVKITKSLKKNYFWRGREWPYKNIKPRVIAEKYMEDYNNNELTDYKFYCFNGEPRFLYVSQGLENHKTARIDFVSLNWNKAPFWRFDYQRFAHLPEKPMNFNEMYNISLKLSQNVPFVRVDLYEIQGQTFFSELTFFPAGGLAPVEPEEWEEKLGKWLDITNIKDE